jgi:hypothetical protein
MTQVGLGTARNFSSARPIFQNLIENVPVAGRAFWEADWEIKMHEERTRMVQKPPKRERRKDGGTEMMMPAFEAVLLEKERKVLADGGELEHYFPAPPVPNVTTCLSIPLVPTPTSRFPLPEFTSSNPSLLPLATLGSLHASHATHALRVSSLFARLDTAHVWTKNVSCSAYAHGPAVGPGDGVCTVLKVEFVGWTAAEVRGVIGESGTGWCVLEELRTGVEEDDDEDASSVLSGMSSEMGGEWRDAGLVESVDLADSFVIPTLDFSVGAAFSPPPTDWASDSGSDISSPSSIDSALSGGSWVQQYPDALLQGSGRFGFSSDFAGRVGSGSGIWGYEYEYELRESIF